MKKISIFIYVFSLMLIYSGNSGCSQHSGTTKQIITPDFKINIDTIRVNTDGILGKSVKVNNIYYAIFRIYDQDSRQHKDQFIIFDSKGYILQQMNLPEYLLNAGPHSLKLRNDSVIACIDYENQTILFDENNLTWQKINIADAPIYEDEEYVVTANDMGEFGGIIFFKNKNTGIKYEGYSHPLIVNKLKGQYYITNFLPHEIGFCSVVKINDPQRMRYSTRDEKTFDFNDYYSRKGMEILLDTTGFYIPLSFIHKDKLLHMYSDMNNAYIATLANKKPSNIFTLPGITDIAYQQELPGNSRLAIFVTDNEKIQGLIETTPRSINIHYIITNGNSGYYNRNEPEF